MWTRESLAGFVSDALAGRKLIVLANREPYLHVRRGEEVRCISPASGVATALDPILRACGGTWVGHGSGDADRETVDERDHVSVPPEDPLYTLRRVWLTREEEEGYYYGFANEALWPLCHVAYARPTFRATDWRCYVEVNRKFADVVLEEAADEPALVFVQDYHFALVSRFLKQTRPDILVAQFWHIPWPNAEVFRICPWRKEILDGLLGNDLLSFHIQFHCNNFLDTVDREIEARIDREQFSVYVRNSPTFVRPLPISIDFDAYQASRGDERIELEIQEWKKRLGLRGVRVGVGIDRLDYTKGIPERLAAVERFFELHPASLGKFSFVEIGVPSRVHLPAYKRLADDVENQVERINWRFGTGRWKPVVLLAEHHDRAALTVAYRAADLCIVSSLHDGMNLVAKEFVAARADGRGVLILSPFTGAARELPDALIANPYATDELAQAIGTALEMPSEEQERRMTALRAVVAEANVFRWGAHLLKEAMRLERVVLCT